MQQQVAGMQQQGQMAQMGGMAQMQNAPMGGAVNNGWGQNTAQAGYNPSVPAQPVRTVYIGGLHWVRSARGRALHFFALFCCFSLPACMSLAVHDICGPGRDSQAVRKRPLHAYP